VAVHIGFDSTQDLRAGIGGIGAAPRPIVMAQRMLRLVPGLPAQSGRTARMTITQSNRRRVLVVDDDDDCCTALRLLLRRAGFDVDVATSGAAALLRIAEFPPDVLLSDLRMPGMDGLDLLREAHAANGFPVILMSGDGRSEDEVLSAGAAAYLVKPLDIANVVRALDHAVPRRNGSG
jgi:CheY-like chemotaxis protein